jgi:RNA polymerase sigma-70 factor (ECF subfamily)
MNKQLAQHLADDLDGAFEALVREHQDRLYSLALRYVGSPSDAEDLTQDAFVRAYRALERYEPPRIRDLDLRAWLTTIVLNVCRNHVVRPSRRAAASAVAIDDAPELSAPTRHDPEAHAERREGAERWARLVASLPPVYRAAVLLRHLDGLSYDEMSGVLGRPEGTLKAQVHRGVALLRAAFEADERARAAGIVPADPTPDTKPGRRRGPTSATDRRRANASSAPLPLAPALEPIR